MISETQISALRAPFPVEALSADTSRGFELTSIKAAFIIERLNEVFGPCGCGWRYVHSPFEFAESEMLTEVALQFRVVEGGCDPVVWDAQTRGWAFAPDSGAWSWPIYAPGGRRPNKGNAPFTDARKGAITDGLTKAASMIGVGQDVFKGLVRTGPTPPKAPERAPQPRKPEYSSANGKGAQSGSTPPQQPTGSAPTTDKPVVSTNGSTNGKAPNGSTPKTNGATIANATTFWLKANQYTSKLDRAQVSTLAKEVIDGTITWLEAQTRLDDMIDAATLPSFGTTNGNAVHEQPSAKPVVEHAADPLDELFA
ncbi:MAG: hypothetical protein KDE09_13290 [Anaerolineales bacterium]|nr:hypothetical protein [Anaerolineales bacterium]